MAASCSFHGVKKNVGRAARCIRLRLSAHVRVVAFVPPFVTEVIDLTNVVATVKRATMMRDSIQLILCCVALTLMICIDTHNLSDKSGRIMKNTGSEVAYLNEERRPTHPAFLES